MLMTAKIQSKSPVTFLQPFGMNCSARLTLLPIMQWCGSFLFDLKQFQMFQDNWTTQIYIDVLLTN